MLPYEFQSSWKLLDVSRFFGVYLYHLISCRKRFRRQSGLFLTRSRWFNIWNIVLVKKGMLHLRSSRSPTYILTKYVLFGDLLVNDESSQIVQRWLEHIFAWFHGLKINREQTTSTIDEFRDFVSLYFTSTIKIPNKYINI